MTGGVRSLRAPARAWGFARTLTVLAAVLAVREAAAEPLPEGISERELTIAGQAIRIAAFKPACSREGPLLVVFHGSDRNSALARDNAVPLGERGCATVVVPLFDEERFRRWAYQLGGLGDIVREDGKRRFRLRPEGARTGTLVLALIDHVRRDEGRPLAPYVLLGHSAGGQFLSRFAAFVENDAERIVIANAGSHALADPSVRYPYGLGGLPPPLGGEKALRRYLASLVVIVAAERDTRRGRLLRTPGAERQGANRWERALRAFATAKAAAESRGQDLRWRFVSVPGLGHGSGRLYARPEVARAVFGPMASEGRPSEVVPSASERRPSDVAPSAGDLRGRGLSLESGLR